MYTNNIMGLMQGAECFASVHEMSGGRGTIMRIGHVSMQDNISILDWRKSRHDSIDSMPKAIDGTDI